MLAPFVLLVALTSSPRTVVAKFFAVYIKQETYGLLEGKNREQLKPFLSRRLLKQLDDVVACEKDWERQQPKDSTDKPPYIDCCLFSIPDGMPTSYHVASVEKQEDGRYKVIVNLKMDAGGDHIAWREAMIVVREGEGFRIDDAYDPDRDSTTLTLQFTECKDGKWMP